MNAKSLLSGFLKELEQTGTKEIHYPSDILGYIKRNTSGVVDSIDEMFSNIDNPYGETGNAYTIKVDSGIKTIKAGAFSSCDIIQRIVLSKTVVQISDEAFRNCRSLIEVTIEEGSELKIIGSSAFHNTGIKSINLPDTVEDIKDGAFSGCHNLKEIRIPQNIVTIPAHMCSYCDSLEKVHMNQITEKIGNQAFRGCQLAEIEFSPTITSIGSGAFEDNRLASVDLYNTCVCEIGKRAFKNNLISSLEIPFTYIVDAEAFAENELSDDQIEKLMGQIETYDLSAFSCQNV